MIRFLGLTFAVTWSAWWLAVQVSAPVPRTMLFLLGTFAPGFVAVGLTAYAGGPAAVATLARRLIAWQVAARWYVFAISYIAVIKLTAALVYRVLAGSWPVFGGTPWYLLFAAAVGSTLSGGQAAEELGWRGYMLPRLAGRLGLAPASVVLGVIWAAWHLPLFFVPEATTFNQSFPVYLLQVTAMSVTLAWLYARTGASLLPVMLLHAAINNTKDIVPSADPNAASPWGLSSSLVAWITVVLLAGIAGVLLWQMRKGSRLERTVVESVVPRARVTV